MSFFSKLWKGITDPLTGRRARKQAQAYYRDQSRAMEEQSRIQQENIARDRENQDRWHKAQMEADRRRHDDNMAAMRESLHQDRLNFDRQLALQQQGLQQQREAQAQALAQAQRQLNNQQAQLQRQLNMSDPARDQGRFNKKESGVAGTILTGPGGIRQDELEDKKLKKSLLGQ